MAPQQQDLSVFADHSVTQIDEKCLSVITHVHGTLATWLVSGLIESYLYGTCNLINTSSNKTISQAKSKVILISFSNDHRLYDKFFKKINLEAVNNANFKFVSVLNEVFDNESVIFEKIMKEITNFTSVEKPLNVVIESPEILLHTTDMETDSYLSFLNSVQKKTTNLTLVSSIDKNMINFQTPSEDSIEFRHTEFMSKLFYRSNVIFNLKPLETGRADDVTGTLTVSKGLQQKLEVVEKEYLFLINKEGNVKLFYR